MDSIHHSEAEHGEEENPLCLQTRIALSENEELAASMRSHLESCPCCRTFCEQTEKMTAELAALSVPPLEKNGVHLADAVMNEVRARAIFGKKPAAFGKKLFRHAGLVAACFIMLVMAAPFFSGILNPAREMDAFDASSAKTHSMNAHVLPDAAAPECAADDDTLYTDDFSDSANPANDVNRFDTFKTDGIDAPIAYTANESIAESKLYAGNGGASEELPDNSVKERDIGGQFSLYYSENEEESGAILSVKGTEDNRITSYPNMTDGLTANSVLSPQKFAPTGFAAISNVAPTEAQDMDEAPGIDADSAIADLSEAEMTSAIAALSVTSETVPLAFAADAANLCFDGLYAVQIDLATATILSDSEASISFPLAEQNASIEVTLAVSDSLWTVAFSDDGSPLIRLLPADSSAASPENDCN